MTLPERNAGVALHPLRLAWAALSSEQSGSGPVMENDHHNADNTP